MLKSFSSPNELKIFMDENGFEKTNIAASYVMACCPFHEDRNPSFGIHYETLDCHCFSCGWFDIESVFERMGIPIEAISDTIEAISSSKWEWIKKSFHKKKKDTILIYGLPESVPIENDPLRLSYMIKRGFNLPVMKAFDIRVAKTHKYFNRVIIPIRDRQGTNMFFDARSTMNNEYQKYLRPKESPVKYSLFGIDKAIHGGPICITEGVLSALKLFQLGVQAVSMCGSYLHHDQLLLLLEKGCMYDPFIIATDNDDRGNRAAKEIYTVLRNTGSEIKRLKLPKGKDPADLKNLDELCRLNPDIKFDIRDYSLFGENSC